MDLKKISNLELTTRLEKLVHSERKITHVILIHILEIESRRIYAELGFDGMFSYLTKGLGYSESAAYRRLQSARLLKTAPAAAAKLEDGSLNLSQLTEVQKSLKFDKDGNKPLEIILAKIENKNSFETKKILAFEFDQPIQSQTVIAPQKNESIRLELTLTKKQFETLEEAKNLMSHIAHSNSLSDVIEQLALKYLKSKTGNGKSDRNLINNTPLPKRNLAAKVKRQRRSYLPLNLKRSLMKNAEHTCQYIDKSTGRKCDSKYQLQVDHIHPLAKGGSDIEINLQILCRTHNHLKGSHTGFE